MSERSVARRYAAALFDVTEREGAAEQAGRDLSAFAQLVAGHPQLKQVFETPAVPAIHKKAIIEALAKATQLGAEVRRLLLMLADRDRLGVLPDLDAAFGVKLLEGRRVMPAEVVTATPLSESGRAALVDALSQATGSAVTLTERVDPAVIGGCVTRVGSLVFDGTVSRQLERMRSTLLAKA
jgi:F-type H+-transporting ATPase subunit delta